MIISKSYSYRFFNILTGYPITTKFPSSLFVGLATTFLINYRIIFKNIYMCTSFGVSIGSLSPYIRSLDIIL